MQRNLFKLNFINYWRNIDKNILISFLSLFFLDYFFLSSTSSLAGERLNKIIISFFKTFYFHNFSLGIMIGISIIETSLPKIIIPLFLLSLICLFWFLIGVEVKGAKRWLDLYI